MPDAPKPCQVYEFVELLRQLSCYHMTISTRKVKRSDRMLSGLPPRRMNPNSNFFELSKDGHVGCNRPAQPVADKSELFEIREGREQLKYLGKRRSCAAPHIFGRKHFRRSRATSEFEFDSDSDVS